MPQRRWPLTVRDDQSRPYRGIVTYTDELEQPLSPPEAPARFHIVLLATRSAALAPERTAICVPGVPKLRPVGAKIPPPSLPRKAADLWFPPRLMAAYRAGRVVTAARGIAAPAEIFPPHSDRPRIDLLALALIRVAAAEASAPYAAVLRHELGLRPGSNALSALDERLDPTDAASQPPRRAPAVARLRNVSKRLHAGLDPQITFEQLTEDLRFLMLFDNAPMRGAALSRLLTDVVDASRPTRRRSAILPFARTEDA